MTHLNIAKQQATRSLSELEMENHDLQRRLHEAEETVRAIQNGAVDAFVVGQQVYTLETADRPYRLMIEQMQQGAATLLVDGTIAYCNATLATLLKIPHQKLIGSVFWKFIDAGDIPAYDALVEQRNISSLQGEARLRRADGAMVPTYLTFNALPQDCGASMGVLVTDLTSQRYHEQMRAAHQALQESEARFREMINAIPTAIYTTDAAGCVTHFNPACVEFSGRTPELGSDKWCVTWRLYHPDGRAMPHAECPMAIALQQGKIIRGAEAIAERPDGTRIWFTPYPTPLRNAAGEIVGGINMLVDITERKLAQEQQSKELRDTKLLQDISAQLIQARDPDALYRQILDAAVRLMKADKGTLQLFDAKTNELHLIASHGIDEKLHEAFTIVTSDSDTSCAAALKTRKRTFIKDFSDGEYRESQAGAAHRAAGVLAAQTTPLVTRSGELLGMMSTHWGEPCQPDERALLKLDILARQTADLIERMQAEASLRQSEARLEMELADTKLLQSVSAQIIHEESVDTLYTRITEAAVAIMQSDFASMQMYYPDRGTNGELRLLAASGLNQEAMDFWASVDVNRGTTCAMALRNGVRYMTADLQNNEHVMNTPDHEKFVQAGVHSAQSTPLYSRNGALLGMLSTHWTHHHTPSDRDLRLLDILARQAADLIERKKAEDALKQSKVALTEADRRKDEFLATLAHELRNPLAPIRNGLHIMRMAPNSNRITELRDMMDRQVTHLVRLIDDLLDVSRVSQGKIDLRRQRITLQSAVQAATEASRPLIEDHKHMLTFHLPGQPLWLDADLTRVAQIVGNLLNNAAKYTPEGGHITVSASSENGHALLSVRDTGIGIPADMLPKVFDLFTQVDRNLDRSQGGLGIGLALVKQLVGMHGGEISATSPGLGLGSEFTVRLPLAPVVEHTLHGLGVPGISPQKVTLALRVLVVDDNIPAAQTTSWMLEWIGHETRLAHNGTEALAAAKAFRPEVILLDIGLPGMNGYELCSELRKDSMFKDTLMIAQTGWGQERDRDQARAAGFDHHLVKPVNFDQLSELLASSHQ